MARPTRITVNSGDNAWEGEVNSNLQQLYDRPLPIYLHGDTLTDLQSTFPAAQYAWCLAIVDYDGAATPGTHLAFSNGTEWKLVSNWEFFNRHTFKGITTTYTVLDADDVVVVTGASTFTITLPAIADANEGRIVTIKHAGTGIITVDGNGSNTIDGAANVQLQNQYDSVILISDGTSNWHLVGNSGSGGGGGAIAHYISRGRTSGTESIPSAEDPTDKLDLPTSHASAGSAVTWNGTNKEFEINATGVYKIDFHVRASSASAGTTIAHLVKDTGGGDTTLTETYSWSGGSGVIRTNLNCCIILSLNSGDTIGLSAYTTAAITGQVELGTHMTLLKIA